MGKKAKFSKEVKLKAIKDYQDGLKSTIQLSNELNCNKKTILLWLNNYDSMGENAFDDKQINKIYSRELKLLAITDYKNGLGSLQDIAKKYKIYSKSTLIGWILKYNSHKEIKDYNPKGDVYMTKSRKTTFEERLMIVKYCLEHDKSYKLAAEEFNQPYSQVYQWVQKYLEQGEERLEDNRGRRKEESELSETDKLNRDLQLLQVKNERLQMENEVLKKFQELERRDALTKSGKKRNT